MTKFAACRADSLNIIQVDNVEAMILYWMPYLLQTFFELVLEKS
ncbi:hypothetical protein [Nostoc sp.]